MIPEWNERIPSVDPDDVDFSDDRGKGFCSAYGAQIYCCLAPSPPYRPQRPKNPESPTPEELRRIENRVGYEAAVFGVGGHHVRQRITKEVLSERALRATH